MNCPKCQHEMYIAIEPRGNQLCFCVQEGCRYFEKREVDCSSRPSLVIEIKNGALANVYSDEDVQIALVDYDEFGDGSGSSAIVIPEKLDRISPESKRLVIDAVSRANPSGEGK